jgi:hypothetical protein
MAIDAAFGVLCDAYTRECPRVSQRVPIVGTYMCKLDRTAHDPQTWAPHNFTYSHLQGLKPIDMSSPKHSLSIPYYFEG